jgi:hypothetical protein
MTDRRGCIPKRVMAAARLIVERSAPKRAAHDKHARDRGRLAMAIIPAFALAPSADDA